MNDKPIPSDKKKLLYIIVAIMPEFFFVIAMHKASVPIYTLFVA